MPDATLKLIAANLKRLRGKRSYGELARAVGGHAITFSRIERELINPNATTLAAVAKALGCTVGDLYAKPNNKKKS
jgi:DNA-binding XRE family transcriptional regulator